jgi:superfamily I DNA/RNA helicase
MNRTDEQVEIVNAAASTPESLMVNAYAGCGKTTTLTMMAGALPKAPALALAFNVRIKKELEERFPDHFVVKTLNGLGHMAWGNAIGKRCIVDDKKLGKIVTEVSRSKGFAASSSQWGDLRRLVSAAMQAGLVPASFPHYKGLVLDTMDTWEDLADIAFINLGDRPEQFISLARAILQESITQSFNGTVSFDDQIYMSALFMGQFPRYPLVMVDEAQDLSPLNHIQVKKCAAERLIVVGDKKQAIYSFRGADSESIAKLRGLRKEWTTLPLATTFRCPKIIVERQQHHAPGFTAFHTNPEGTVVRLKEGWRWSDVPHDPSIAVLCRNNAPLLSMAFKLLRSGVGCYMIGRDIGKGLLALSKKILPSDDTKAEDCAILINEWITHEQILAHANDNEDKAERALERGECLLAVLNSAKVPDAGRLRAALESIFARESGVVTLATGHRAKGMEWNVVVHLDPWRVPSKQAKAAMTRGNPVPMEQEQNLLYVLETRARNTLVLANLEEMEA